MPFLRFIITLFLRGKDAKYIYEKVRKFGYSTDLPRIEGVFLDLKRIASASLMEILECKVPLDLSNESHEQWAKELGVYEYCDYLSMVAANANGKPPGKQSGDKKPYYKWIEDIHWIHSFKDILAVVNTFMFNGEPLEEISDIISFKYRKKIGVDALELHRQIFWDTTHCSAKDVISRCAALQNNSTVIKTLATGEQTFTEFKGEHKSNGHDINMIFHPSDYIKWKIGYRQNIKPPSPRDFIESVKLDSYFKYYESMNMSDCVEWSEMEQVGGGEGAFGNLSSTTKHYKNVEENRAKLSKHWFDMFLKAHKALPEEEETNENFFDRLNQYALKFDEEKIANADELAGLIDDVRGDLH